MTAAKRLFAFLGHQTKRDLAEIVRDDRMLQRLHANLKRHMDPDRARVLIEDMLAVALQGAGEHFLRRKGAAIDKIVKARNDLITIFEKVANEGPRADLKGHIANLDRAYHELENGLADLQRHVTKDPTPSDAARTLAARIRQEVKSWTAAKGLRTPRPITADTREVSGQSRLTSFGFKKHVVKGRTVYRFTFADKATAELWVVDGKFHVRTRTRGGYVNGEFHENKVVLQRYGSLPRTTDVFQFHHGIEGDLMSHIFGDLYVHDDVPTICLRDSLSGSPHRQATDLGNTNRATRKTAGLTYAKIREYARADLAAAQVPTHAIENYLLAIDAHVRAVILPKLSAKQKARMLGGWQ